MAPRQMYVVFAIVLTVLPSLALATDFMVGDDSGWTIKFDYRAWADNKVFRVGDNLVFKYPVGKHNVIKVNGTGFQSCQATPANEVLITGNDIINLKATGKKWYICGVEKHCADGGQKLVIDVQPALQSSSPTSPPIPSPGDEPRSSAHGIIAYGYQSIAATAAAIALLVMV